MSTTEISEIYIFSFNIRAAYNNSICYVDLIKGPERLVSTFDKVASYAETIPSVASVHLKTGDTVLLRNRGYGTSICKIDNESTLTGFLLYPDQQ